MAAPLREVLTDCGVFRLSQAKMDDVRMDAARSRSFWVTEAMVAAITTGDSAIGAAAEDAEQELCDKIQKMIESAPSMDAIIAVRQGAGAFRACCRCCQYSAACFSPRERSTLQGWRQGDCASTVPCKAHCSHCAQPAVITAPARPFAACACAYACACHMVCADQMWSRADAHRAGARQLPQAPCMACWRSRRRHGWRTTGSSSARV